jgi:hypothetical protein
MIVRVVARGQSFKKLAAYLTSPRDGQHRALWSMTENVAVDDPRTAAKIMAHVAMNADALKEAAGVGSGGRKSKIGPVYHAIMSWAEGQRPTPEHQQQAARSMLKAVGLEQAQALIVAHNDNGKEHLHVMVNLVDPETGRRFNLSNDHKRMEAWALEYERATGEVLVTKRAEKAEGRKAGDHPARAERFSRPQADRMDRAARESTFARQADERAALRELHSAEWREAKADAAAHRSAYKAAFRAAYAKAKAEDRAANKPQWAAVFRAQKLEAAQIEATAAQARRQTNTARQELRAAHDAVTKAERRAKTLLGGFAQKIGLAYTPEAAAFRLENARAAVERAALALAQIELKRAGLKVQQESERQQLARVLGENTFTKAQLATDGMSRADFGAMIARQADEKARQIAAHNAERDALGMKRYEPKTTRKGEPMADPQLTEKDAARRAFARGSDRRQPEAQTPPKAQGAHRVLTPSGYSKGNTPGAPAQQPQQTAEADRTSFGAAELAKGRRAEDRKLSPVAAARERNNTPEAKAARQADQTKARQRDRSRDFDNER